MALSGFFAGIILVLTGLLTPDMFMFFVILTGVSGVDRGVFQRSLARRAAETRPSEKMGRVMGLFTTVSALSSPIGLALAGTCAEFTGVANWFIIAGVVVSIGGVLLGTLPILTKLDKEIAATFDDPKVVKRKVSSRSKGSEKRIEE